MNATLSLEGILQMLQPLSADNKRWLGERLSEESREEERLAPYTMEEINAWIDESEADFAAGRYISNEEMNRRMEQFREVCYK